MTRYEFVLILEEPGLADKDCAALFEAGCGDGTVVTRDGVTYIAFDREADSLEAALGSAIAQVMNAGHVVTRAEVDDGKGGEDSRRVLWTVEDLAQDELREYFCHFVALSGCYHQIDFSKRPTGHAGAFHYSGFILEVNGQWHWVTAAHVFDHKERGIETLRQTGKIEIDECVLNDSFSTGRSPSASIPFKYWEYESVALYDDDLKLDICALILTAHHQKLLEANGVVPLSEDHWQCADLSELQDFLLIGLPEELEQTKVAFEPGGYRVRTRPTPFAVYITRVEDVTTDSVRPTPRFVGRIKKEAGNIGGMSGGPIFGVRPGDPKHYLVAVQSSRSTTTQGLIFGCPVTILIELLKKYGTNKGNASL